jgi:hypothetical protein
MADPLGRGRPTLYTDELAARICAELAAGNSLNSICKAEGMPDEVTVREWAIHDRQGFSAKYTQARDIGLDVRADRIMEVVDGHCDPEYVAHRRLRFDAWRWYLSKMAPKRYGDAQTHKVQGDPDKPLTVVIRHFTVPPDEDEDQEADW